MIVCYECKKPGHMRGERPELKKKLKKDKFTFKKAKAMMATWSDEDEDDNAQGSSRDEDIQFLMARSEDSNEVNSSFENYTVDEWEEAYTLLFEKICKFKTPKHHGFLNTLHQTLGDDFTSCWGRVEEFLEDGEQEIAHTKPFFFPVASAVTCTDSHLEVDQRRRPCERDGPISRILRSCHDSKPVTL
ncbi:hypothetical protein Taro_003294 [Colocasia esculenta]|uniref:Uncharacterized protein n=1 Tax=Colocasia esculenta TaxID=4460 RepID=A0A843TLN0_COLES|nr:hypothetical protein [Colocasia esculenta]